MLKTNWVFCHEAKSKIPRANIPQKYELKKKKIVKKANHANLARKWLNDRDSSLCYSEAY